MKRFDLCILVFVVLSNCASMLHAQVYRVGDTVEDFELIDRSTGQPARLSDFEGSILILEWFAVWCPYCQAAAPQIDEGILQYYANTGGNPNGVPVVRIGINLEAGSRYKTSTDAFITEHHLYPTLEDTSRQLAREFFEGGSGQPLFAVINGVANSPTHAQWEVLLLRNGYLSTNTPIGDFRTAINRVAAPALEPPTPVRLIGTEPPGSGVLRLRIEGNRRDEIVLRRSDDLMTWMNLDTPIPAEEGDVLELAVAALSGDRFVQAVRLE